MTNLRKKLQQAWFTVFLLTVICLGLSHIFRTDQPRLVRRDVFEFPIKEQQQQQTTTPRLVTRSLNQLENTRELSDHVLFFNRVPKTGSEMLVLLLQWLQGVNGFRHIRLPGGYQRRLSHDLQEALVEEVTRTTRSEAVPVSFDRHVYFVNFTTFGKQPPVFINLVRDPVEKAISRFYYQRVTPNPLNPDIRYKASTTTRKPPKFGSFEDCLRYGDPECAFVTGKSYDLTIPYFCGHNKRCMILNDDWALSRAKKNIELYFPVVGVLEELNNTLTVLENRLPLFFKGVSQMYYSQLLEPHKNANRKRPRAVDPFIRSHLQRQLACEYDLYYWLRARLLGQLNSIRLY